MLKKLFVLGCSGSGKSTAARYISVLARDRRWSADFINDYSILYEMFRADSKHEKFRLTAHNGFDVIDMSVYDMALDELSRQAQNLTVKTGENELVIVEFARCDYREALKHFDDHFLRTAHFLFLDADIETCKRRISERIICPRDLDDHFVPNHVIECFGQASCKHYIESELKLDYGITNDKVRILDTARSIEAVTADVEQFVADLLLVLVSNPT